MIKPKRALGLIGLLLNALSSCAFIDYEEVIEKRHEPKRTYFLIKFNYEKNNGEKRFIARKRTIEDDEDFIFLFSKNTAGFLSLR